jgi:DNA-binding transcriptional ArsR family regulator
LKVSSRDAVRVFKALSDVTRVEMVQLLGRGPRNVTELTSLVGVSQPKVSRHLKILRDAGLLRDVRKGKWVWYELALPGKGEPTGVVVTALNSLFWGKEPRSSGQETRGAAERSRGAAPDAAAGRRVEVSAHAGPVGESGATHIVTGKAPHKGGVRVDKESSRKRTERGSPKKKELEDFLL